MDQRLRINGPPDDSADFDRRLDGFEEVWRSGPPPAIEDFLPPGTEARRELLAELVKIDLEYRWRGTIPPSIAAAEPPERLRLEDYVERFPELERLPITLIGEEYRVRQRWGDRPGYGEYLGRFPGRGTELREIVDRIDTELAAESAREPVSAEAGPEPSSPTSIRCPHCHQSIEVVAELVSRDIACPSCGGTFSIETFSAGGRFVAAPPVPRVGRYELQRLLGTGAFGSVWRAWDTKLAREVAVKLPRSGQFPTRAEEERFLREARSNAQLHHPGIVAVHDVGRDQDTVYIVSDLVLGRSLAQWLRSGPLSFREAAELVARVADALDYAHRQGVVHRDVKPSNIMLEEAEPEMIAAPEKLGAHTRRPSVHRPRIMDFGLAKRDAGEITMTLDGQMLGTPAYISPEQIRNPHAVDGRSDVYSLGVILYELLTGELPFRGTTRMLLLQVICDEPRPPRQLNEQIARDLETICLKCLAKEPVRRYRTAGALSADLRRWLVGESIEARPAGKLERLWRWLKRNPVLVVTGGLAVVVVVGVLGAPATGLLVALAIAAGFYAVRQTKAAAEVAQTAHQVSRDQQRTAAALEVALKQCYLARHERDRAFTTAAQARRRFDPAHELAHAFIIDFADKIADLPARALLVQKALAYLDHLREDAGEDRLLQRELAAAYSKVGDLQGHPLVASRGEPERALASYRSSVGLLEVLVKGEPRDDQVQGELAAIYEKIGDVEQTLGRHTEALASYCKGLEVQRTRLQAEPAGTLARRGVAVCQNKIGNMHRALGQTQEALASYRESLAITEALIHAGTNRALALRDLAVACHKVGLIAAQLGLDAQGTLEQRLQCWLEAQAYQQRALDIILAIQQRGALPSADVGVPDMLAAEITRCEEMIAQLKNGATAADPVGERETDVSWQEM